MHKRIAIIFAAILVCALLAPVAVADEKGCTVANVKGTYGYVGFGQYFVPNPLGLPAGTLSQTGTLTFDGKGNLLIVDTGRVDTIVFPPDIPYPSKYTVDDQCIVTFTLMAWADAGIPGPHFKGVFVDNRKGLRVISVVPWFIANYVNTSKVRVEDKDEDKD